jgi:RimJ/RimL family protein N-acetyltransferase
MSHPWPLFDLRIRSEGLELRLPTDDELVELLGLASAGIHPPDEMPFGISWTDLPSPQFERGFLQYHWSVRAGWTPADWILNLGVWNDGQLVGTQGLGAKEFASLRVVHTGSWLGREFQGHGIGKKMRAAVLGLAFDHLGAEWATSGAFIDNPASLAVSRALGYQPDGYERHAPRGVAKDLRRFRMTLDDWRSRARPAVDVVGLDACRDLFGLA